MRYAKAAVSISAVALMSVLSSCGPHAGTIPMTAKATSPNDVLIEWDPVPAATVYRMAIRYPDSGFRDSVDLGVRSTGANPSGLSPNEWYEFQLTALGPNGEIGRSRVVRVRTPPARPRD